MSNSPATQSRTLHLLLLSRDEPREGPLLAQLAGGGFNPDVLHVVSSAGFSRACLAGRFDLIVVDADLPGIDVGRTLDQASKYCPDVPLIVIGSVTDEQLVVECVRRGAADFVHKDRIDRLAPAIEAALEQHARRIAAGGLAAYPESQQEAILRQIAEHTQDIICLHAPDRSVKFVTSSLYRVLGYHPEEFLGRRPREFAHPDDLERVLAEVDEHVMRSGSGVTVAGRYRHKDGHYVWLETKIQPIVDDQGRTSQLISVSRDVSERKRVEETLRRGEQLFVGIAEANRLLLTARRVMECLPAVLQALGEAVGADRVVVFEIRAASAIDSLACSLRAEWTRHQARSFFAHADLAEIALSDVAASQDIAAGRLPAGLHRVLERHGFVNMLEYPVLVNGRSWGAIGFDQEGANDEWSPAATSALRMVALNIGQAIEREEALAAVAESQRRYEALLAGLSEAVFQIDLEARWRFLNPTWENLTGFRVDESIGRRFSSFVAPEQAPDVLENFGRLVSGRDERMESEVRFLHRLGRGIWLRVMAQPQFDEEGRVIGVSGTLVDVTQRRLAQEALQASERKFAAVFHASADAIFLFDNATNLIVECNPRAVEMFECNGASELIGTNGTSLLLKPVPPHEQERGMARLDRGETWSDEMQYATRRGRVFWGLFSVVRMAPENMGTTLVRVTDITELKDSEERLRASLGEKEVLLKEVYHRVKNNLQIISALLRMQCRRVKDHVAIEALENSISRVMAMSMVHEKLYQAQNLVSIDFFSFAQSLVGFLNQLTIGGQAGVSISVRGEPLSLSIDQAIPLGLILNELVTNSLKYAFPDGRSGRVSITIASEAPGGANVAVADDGIGLPEQLNIEDSAGLGFRIVRMLVEQLHGELEIESRKGLTVAVRVPPPVFRPHEIAVS